MSVEDVIQKANELGVTLSVSDIRIQYSPKSAAPPEFVELLRENKADLIRLLVQQGECFNPLTSHERHEHKWECNPYSCMCYRQFGFPRFCEGAPCRWIWPDGVPNTDGAI